MNSFDDRGRGNRLFSPFSSPDRMRRRLRISLRSMWRSSRLLCYSVLVGILGGLGAQIFIWMLSLGERIFLGGIAGYIPPELGVMQPAPHFGPCTF